MLEAAAAQGDGVGTEVGTLVLALCDGLGNRLMLEDPRIDLATAQSTIWRAIAPALGIAPVFPEVAPGSAPGVAPAL
ncbi:hypothetical protein [Streptomyces sp. AP-93]|uniref:hypothetical protein n=1 Tax=Streptomyces sp. AP-93 TaxID=2929048 RepID=UPI001FAF43EE|nr:hypothetical protein [Streptomyces sp. AP-93]MCJ0869570.1 hypothetical protein [Streptomyces sp. AP-93]